MKILKKRSRYLVVSAVLLTLAAGAAAKLNMYNKLDLTDEQQTQLKEMRGDKKQQHKAFKANIESIKKKGIALLDNYSESEAQKIAQEMADAVKQKTLSRLAHHQAVYVILTQEQKQKYKKILSERKMKHEFKRKHGSDHHDD